MNPSDRRDFGNLLNATVCAGSTGFCQVKGGCTKGRQPDQGRQSQGPDILPIGQSQRADRRGCSGERAAIVGDLCGREN